MHGHMRLLCCCATHGRANRHHSPSCTPNNTRAVAPLRYVHAIAHTLGAFFGVPHGAANAAVLPHVLSFYLDNGCVDQLADLAVAIGAAPSYTEHTRSAADRRVLAESFIKTVRDMNAEMGIQGAVKASLLGIATVAEGSTDAFENFLQRRSK